MNRENLRKKTVVELKEIARKKGVSTTGKKDEIIGRLLPAKGRKTENSKSKTKSSTQKKMEIVKTQDKNGREMYFKIVKGKKVRISKEVALSSSKSTKKTVTKKPKAVKFEDIFEQKVWEGYLIDAGPSGVVLRPDLPWQPYEEWQEEWEIIFPKVKSIEDFEGLPSQDIKTPQETGWRGYKFVPYKVKIRGLSFLVDENDTEFLQMSHPKYIGPA